MSSCKLDHSNKDVQKKLSEQQSHLPEQVHDDCKKFLFNSPTQAELNELFHLLKKYDLASDEEKVVRDEKLKDLVTS